MSYVCEKRIEMKNRKDGFYNFLLEKKEAKITDFKEVFTDLSYTKIRATLKLLIAEGRIKRRRENEGIRVIYYIN